MCNNRSVDQFLLHTSTAIRSLRRSRYFELVAPRELVQPVKPVQCDLPHEKIINEKCGLSLAQRLIVFPLFVLFQGRSTCRSSHCCSRSTQTSQLPLTLWRAVQNFQTTSEVNENRTISPEDWGGTLAGCMDYICTLAYHWLTTFCMETRLLFLPNSIPTNSFLS